MKILLFLKNKFQYWVLNQLLQFNSVDISPEPNVYGVMDKIEEEEILARIYEDKELIALFRKYAEGANKAMVVAVRNKLFNDALRFNGQFYCYSNLIIKSRKAYSRLKKKNESKGGDEQSSN